MNMNMNMNHFYIFALMLHPRPHQWHHPAWFCMVLYGSVWLVASMMVGVVGV